MKHKISIFLVAFLFVSFGVKAQTTYAISKESTMKIDGSSTVSDWAVEVAEATGNFTTTKEINIQVDEVLYSNLEFSFPVDKMDGGRGPIMNSKIKKSLISDIHPFVTYKSKENKITSVDGNKFILESVGTITAAGVNKPITVQLNGVFDKELQTVNFQGAIGVTMTMFHIVKPTAFFGKLKTKDALTVNFNVNYIKQ